MAVVVLDNGAFTAKIGYSTSSEPKLVPNCVVKAKNVRTRIFIGDQIEECKDLSGLYYLLAFQKGYLVNWEIEKQVWDHMYHCLEVNYGDSSLVLTEPYFNFSSIQDSINEILFEDYQFYSILRCNSGLLSQYKHQKDGKENKPCCLVIDSGYSFTHIIPYYENTKIASSIRRLNVGGKVLTNHLKEIISYRQLMVMDETYVINQLKEDVCYVSTNFSFDMKIARKQNKENHIACNYVLPDYAHIKRGYVQKDSELKPQGVEQIIRMNNERFTIPEILFHPSDIGIQEMGIAEAIIHSVNSLPEDMRSHMYENIILTGGNCRLPGFKERLYEELRSQIPDDFDLTISLAKNPVTHAWEGGIMMSQDFDFHSKMVVTRKDYEEHGSNICLQKFDI